MSPVSGSGRPGRAGQPSTTSPFDVTVTPPRIETPSTFDSVRGQELIQLAADLGLPLLPWQARVALAACATDVDGSWSKRTVALTVARQNGKTHLLRMRVLAGLLLWDERLIIATAQSRNTALETFRSVTELAEQHPKVANLVRRVVRSYGREELELTNGCRYKIVAPTSGGARGLTASLVIIDELREHKTDDAWAALGYTTQTTGGPTWVSSNAGDQSSVVLNRIREQAMAAVAAPGSDPTLHYAEWSAKPERDTSDRDGWAEANPALGLLIDESTLAARYKSDPPNVWRTEALCQWVDVLDSPWPPEAWADCYEAGLELDPTMPTFLAIDVTPDRKHAALVAVQQRPDDILTAHLLDTWDAEGAIDDLKVAGTVAAAARKIGARVVAFDRWTAAGIASRLAGAGIPVGDCSGPAFSQACDELLGAMVSGRLRHAGQATLTEHVLSTAKKFTADGGWRIIRAKSSGPVAGAVALAMATHFAVEPLPRAQVIFA